MIESEKFRNLYVTYKELNSQLSENIAGAINHVPKIEEIEKELFIELKSLTESELIWLEENDDRFSEEAHRVLAEKKISQ